MSFNALNLNNNADLESAFLGFEENNTDLIPQKLHNSHVKLYAGGKYLRWGYDRLPFDGEHELQKLKTAEQLHQARHLLSLAEGSETSKDYRLVKKCKSPTRLEKAFETLVESKRMQSKSEFFARADTLDANHAEWLKLPLRDQRYTVKNETHSIDLLNGFRSPAEVDSTVNEETGEITFNAGVRGAVARIYEREWANSYRIRVMAQGSASEPPPQQSGDRETSQLSQKGASKILDSGAYVAAVRGGFTTFLTLTFDSEARQRIVNQENTIGKEVSRFFDAISKTYLRGWQCAGEVLKHKNGFDCIGASEKVAPVGEALDYLWVAEMPENKDGEPNPHCHVLLRWAVEPHLFHDWAAKIESLWGLGFAKLERIRNADAASGYLLKALGYVVKGESKEQGQFKGNRYNISKAARAPAWECLAEFEAQNMCAIINEIREKWIRKDKPIRSAINFTKKKLAKYKEAYNIQKTKKGRTQAQRNHTLSKMQKRIAEFEESIKANYKKLTERGARANEYQVTFNSPELLAKFIGWANTNRYWGAEVLGGCLRDYSFERQAVGELVKQARDYWKSFGDNQEYQEMLWPQRLNQEFNDEFEGISTDEFYNEYYNWQELAA